jgi:hypothetical protein
MSCGGWRASARVIRREASRVATLLAGHLVFILDADGGYTFTAEGRLEVVVAGRRPGLPTSVVSPTGLGRRGRQSFGASWPPDSDVMTE